jgi:hypothetical protein
MPRSDAILQKWNTHPQQEKLGARTLLPMEVASTLALLQVIKAVV